MCNLTEEESIYCNFGGRGWYVLQTTFSDFRKQTLPFHVHTGIIFQYCSEGCLK